MHYRGPNEAAIAQRLWSIFAELRTRSAGIAPAHSDLARFAAALGARLNRRIAHGPERLFEGDYDAARVREYARGEGLSLSEPASEPAVLLSMWTRLAEGVDHAPWALIERWDAAADALAEVCTAMQPALSARWESASLDERVQIIERYDDGQIASLRAFGRGALVEYWCELLSLDAALGSVVRERFSRRRERAEVVANAALSAAMRATLLESRSPLSLEQLESAMDRSIDGCSFGMRSHVAQVPVDWGGPLFDAIERSRGCAMRSLRDRFEDAVRCPDLRAMLETARVKDAKRLQNT